jgi:hypothetical protein
MKEISQRPDLSSQRRDIFSNSLALPAFIPIEIVTPAHLAKRLSNTGKDLNQG